MSYSDVKPEVVENDIRLVRFIPVTSQNGTKPGDLIKFQLTGQGFLDPYTTYLRFDVTCTFPANSTEVRFLDRSAHSFIQRFILRSNQVELERIENYDVQAAMINDMIYSPEQNEMHNWEGFPAQQIQLGQYRTSMGAPNIMCDANIGMVDGRKYDSEINPGYIERSYLGQILGAGASPIVSSFVGESAFCNLKTIQNLEFSPGETKQVDSSFTLDTPYLLDQQAIYDASVSKDTANASTVGKFSYPLDFVGHELGVRIPFTTGTGVDPTMLTTSFSTTRTYIIPLYSGLLGVLMPQKKLIPLSLLPLEIDIYTSLSALYSSNSANDEEGTLLSKVKEDGLIKPNGGSRQYVISNCNLFANVTFFEQEVHRNVEAQVADRGLFIYGNSFNMAPINIMYQQQLPSNVPINMNLKGINSVHTVFIYTGFETNCTARKLHFVSHNISSLQLLNGTQFVPQEAIIGTGVGKGGYPGTAGDSFNSCHVPFVVELYKSWGKMHDPTQDGAIQPYNYCGDGYYGQQDALENLGKCLTGSQDTRVYLNQLVNKQGLVGRCQYGITLEGEELGEESLMLTGRKSQMPFLLQMKGNRQMLMSSYMITFLRADYLIFIRPDMQVVVLGK